MGPLYAPSPQAMLITELKKCTMLLSNSSRNNFTQILQCSINIVQGEEGFLTFCVFGPGVSLTFCQDCSFLRSQLSQKKYSQQNGKAMKNRAATNGQLFPVLAAVLSRLQFYCINPCHKDTLATLVTLWKLGSKVHYLMVETVN